MYGWCGGAGRWGAVGAPLSLVTGPPGPRSHIPGLWLPYICRRNTHILTSYISGPVSSLFLAHPSPVLLCLASLHDCAALHRSVLSLAHVARPCPLGTQARHAQPCQPCQPCHPSASEVVKHPNIVGIFNWDRWVRSRSDLPFQFQFHSGPTWPARGQKCAGPIGSPGEHHGGAPAGLGGDDGPSKTSPPLLQRFFPLVRIF